MLNARGGMRASPSALGCCGLGIDPFSIGSSSRPLVRYVRPLGQESRRCELAHNALYVCSRHFSKALPLVVLSNEACMEKYFSTVTSELLSFELSPAVVGS